MREHNEKLRIRSPLDLENQMKGLLILGKVLDKTLDNWFLSGGTLLGAVRDQDFIRWDWDVEVTIFSEEAIKKESVLLKRLISAGFEINSSDSSLANFKIVAAGWGTKYEILGRYLDAPKQLRIRAMTQVPSRFFEEIKMITLRGHSFPAPSPTEKFLVSLYGDWQIPKRTTDKKKYFSVKAYKPRELNFCQRLFNKVKSLITLINIQEFPSAQKAFMNKFYSWDNELGWCNKSNLTKVDKLDFFSLQNNYPFSPKVFSIDSKGSRECRFPHAKMDVSMYGDGFCMCRGVNDHETFAWYLGELRQTRVSNYGVGKYGLDQSLLKLERDYHKDPAKNIVISVTTSTMARCASVYQHYFEPGNILFVKPRFKVRKFDGSLQLITHPLKNKQDLLNLKKYKKYFREHDDHYKSWIKNKICHSKKILLRKIYSKLGYENYFEYQKKFEYDISFWNSHKKLFIKLMEFYQQLSEKYDFKPIFLLQHNEFSLKYHSGRTENKLPWASSINEASKKFPKIIFLDEAKVLLKNKSIKSFYDHMYHSAKCNKIIAEYLNERL